ncbi:unnamed protein product [Rhizophagus irregularis]|uniref:Uncharacterized protein n=1 Tax=Rhizophagus irregularis TaxID=588596 RepID=A0A915Z7Z7_9GLOM|nr:unnamed protein product [Rhizophagus irregularis]
MSRLHFENWDQCQICQIRSKSDDPEEFAKSIGDKAEAIYLESMGTPKFNIPDFEAICKIAYSVGTPVIVDNVLVLAKFTSTKWIPGHGTTIGGVAIDGVIMQTKNSRDTSCFNGTSTINGRRTGVNKEMIRVSVGYEHIDDIKEDFTIVFEKN